MEGDYIVFLPTGVNVSGYEKVPKIAETHAGGERKAVSNVLFRNLPRKSARIIMSKLDKNFKGVENYAVIVPEVNEGDEIYIDYIMADELASKDNAEDSSKYVNKARFLLRGVEKLPSNPQILH